MEFQFPNLYASQLFGCTLLTDNQALAGILNRMGVDAMSSAWLRTIEHMFAGLPQAVAPLMKQLSAKQASPSLIIYVNFRLQVWAGKQYNCPPSDIVTYIPPD